MTTHGKEIPMKEKRTVQELEAELRATQSRLEDAEETLRAIRNNEIDALIVDGLEGQQVFTLQGADLPYRTLMETMSEGALTVATDGTILYCNGHFSEMVEMPLNMIIGASIYHLVVSPNGQSLIAMLQACGREDCRGEFFLKTAKGGEVPVSLSARSFMMNDVEAFCIVATDLSDQKHAQEALEEAYDHLEEKVAERTATLEKEIADRKKAEDVLSETEARFRLALRNAPVSVAIQDRNLVYQWAYNQKSRRPDEIVGKTDPELFAPEDVAMILEDKRKVIESGTEVHVQRWLSSNSRRFYLDLYYEPLRDSAGKISGIGIAAVDLTEQKLAQDALLEAKKEVDHLVEERTVDLKCAYGKLLVETEERQRAEEQLIRVQKLEALGTLAGGIAHDFNNILEGIIGFAEMVYEDLIPDSPEHKKLGLVLKGAQRGRDLVKQILAFSRQNEPDKKVVAVNEIVEEGIKLLRPMLPSTIEIVTKSLTTDDRVFADPVQIHQILMNLCSNAAYAMREKGGVLELRISKVDFSKEGPLPFSDMVPGEYVVLVVQDTGTGMTPETIDRIFDPFFTTKKQGEGTGLGLSVLHGIVQRHDGCVSVESEPGKGTTFYVYLPKANGQAFAEDGNVSGATKGNERILFVDDEDMLITLNEQRLTRLGYDVVATTSSMDALDIFRKDPDAFDLVITDFTMPNMTGVDFATELLKVKPTTRIILCTGDSEPVTRERIQESGIKAFLMKPLTKSELAQTIRSVLDAKTEE
jgi:PAS domain S-box-containing protein